MRRGEIRLVDFNPALEYAALEFLGHAVTLAVMFDGRNDRDGHSYRAALAEFIADRGRYPELGDVLERDRLADIGTNESAIGGSDVDPEVSPPQRGRAPSLADL